MILILNTKINFSTFLNKTMAKEWILNSAMNRFQLNFKRNVGPTSESIRKCSPKSLDEWRDYYFNNVKPKEHIWDRLFNVDFFIMVNDKYIGLQFKPVNSGIQLPEIFKEYNLQAETHLKFTEVFGGKVSYLFSEKIGERKEIKNKEVIGEIEKEIKRLTNF